MPEFEEWSEKKEAESKENSIEQTSERNQARYALKRGRIPQARSFGGNDEAVAVPANIVDVEYDAIGARSQGKSAPNVHPVKKSTEVVEEPEPTISGRQSHSYTKTVRHGNAQKPKFHGEKTQSYSKIIPEKGPSTKCRHGLFKFWDKILKFFGIKSKDLENSKSEPLNHKKMKYNRKDKDSSRLQHQNRKNNYSKKVK
ncbi:MAG: hypothetical protein LBQ23_01695 [Puniceicoccales bacterium]|jgi:hypothetical protein|nr:hypothetical protein [Puniceicoccales bacterium]